MKATISGQAGLAAVENRGKIHLYSVDDPELRIEIRETQLAPFFCGATDTSVLDFEDAPAVVAALKASWQQDRLLQMLLLLLRKDVDMDVKLEAVEVAEELAESLEASRFVRNRLFSQPLPDDADIATAAELALRSNARNVSALLWRLSEYQYPLTAVTDAWRTIAAGSPDPARIAMLRRALETSGILYRLASATDQLTLDVIEAAVSADARFSKWPETPVVVKRLADTRRSRTPRQQNTSDAEEFLLTHLETIKRTSGFVCRTNHLSFEESEEFASDVTLALVTNDYNLIRQFDGRSSFSTYLTAVIVRLFHERRVKEWGTWRPSMEAKRLGTKAVTLERLLTRDGFSFREACQFLAAGADPASITPELEAIYVRLPLRQVRPVLVSEQHAMDVAAASQADDEALMHEQQERARTAAEILDHAMSQLVPEDQLILKMRFWQGKKAQEIAAVLHLDQRILYRRMGALLMQVRRELERRGIGPDDIDDLLSRTEIETPPRAHSATASQRSRREDHLAATNRLLQAL